MFDEKSFFIPRLYSDPNKSGSFSVYDDTVNDGSFNKLYNYLHGKDQSLIKGAWNFFIKENSLNKILSANTMDGHSPKMKEFLRKDNHKKAW